MADKKFDLGDYVEVKDRIKLFYELYAKGALVTDQVEILTDPAGKQRVMVRALAFRSPEDPHPAVGHSWLELPGTTPYTKGSEVENAETSAWGRAIAALGILVDRSIASAQEVANKADGPTGPTPRPTSHEATTDGGLIGLAALGDAPADYQLREEPDGWALSFKLMDGRKGFRVVARDDLAAALAPLAKDVIGFRVTCWGRMGTDSFVKDGRKITYNVLELARIATPDWILPSDTTARNADAARAESSEPTAQPSAPIDPEIESLPLFETVA